MTPMDLYEALKYIHILAAVAWVGGVIRGHVHGAWVNRKDADPSEMLRYIQLEAFLGQRYYMPASIIVVLAGVGMVLESGWNFSDTWIVIGIVLYLTSVVIGAVVLTPQSEKIVAGLAAGPPDAALQETIKKVVLLSRIDLVILVLVIADMVIKPGT